MANIKQELEKKISLGFIYIDDEGKYFKDDNIKKYAEESYWKGLKSGEINGYETSLSDYVNLYITQKVNKVEDVLLLIDVLLKGKKITVKKKTGDIVIDSSELEDYFLENSLDDYDTSEENYNVENFESDQN